VRFEPTNSTIVPAGRGSGHPQQGTEGAPLPAHVAMGWAQRLKRVFEIEIETCEHCGGKVKVIESPHTFREPCGVPIGISTPLCCQIVYCF
jgi:hypothetical protein